METTARWQDGKLSGEVTLAEGRFVRAALDKFSPDNFVNRSLREFAVLHHQFGQLSEKLFAVRGTLPPNDRLALLVRLFAHCIQRQDSHLRVLLVGDPSSISSAVACGVLQVFSLHSLLHSTEPEGFSSTAGRPYDIVLWSAGRPIPYSAIVQALGQLMPGGLLLVSGRHITNDLPDKELAWFEEFLATECRPFAGAEVWSLRQNKDAPPKALPTTPGQPGHEGILQLQRTSAHLLDAYQAASAATDDETVVQALLTACLRARTTVTALSELTFVKPALAGLGEVAHCCTAWLAALAFGQESFRRDLSERELPLRLKDFLVASRTMAVRLSTLG